MLFERNCMNCGHTVNFMKWGPGKICPSCGKRTVNVDIKEVHVIFGRLYSESFKSFISDKCLKKTMNRTDCEYHVGVDYRSLWLTYELCFGDISDPPYSNANYYAHRGYSASIAELRIKEQLEKLDDLGNNVPIYLWLNDGFAKELMNLLYFAKEFMRFENVYLVKWYHTEKSFNGSRITMRNALNNRKRLSKQDIADLRSRFEEIQSLKADCLIGNSENVEPWEFSKVEEYVLRCMTDEYCEFTKIASKVDDLIKKETSLRVEYFMVHEALHRLMMVGKIKSRGDCELWGEACYNNMIFTQEFRFSDPPQKRNLNKNDVLVVCEAFQYGFTYPLYNMLDDSSVLIKGEDTVCGRWNVIEYIENDGSYHVNCCEEKAICYVYNVVKKRCGDCTEATLILRYEKNEAREGWMVKLVIDGSVIRRIEMVRIEEDL